MPHETVDAARQGVVLSHHVAHPEEEHSIWGRLKAVVAVDAFVNLLVVAALGIGFFHGWLKLRFRSPITTFAYDVVLILALVVVYLRSGSMRQFLPPGPTTKALVAFYGLCLAYLPFSLIPGMPPFLVALSTLRGWIFATLLYGLGYQIIRGRAQLHGYFLVILLLALMTAIYGIQQSDAEVIQMMKEAEHILDRVPYPHGDGRAARLFRILMEAYNTVQEAEALALRADVLPERMDREHGLETAWLTLLEGATLQKDGLRKLVGGTLESGSVSRYHDEIRVLTGLR